MTTTNHHNGECGTWTDRFTQLHHAATSGASAEETRRLKTAELHHRGEQS